MSVEVIAISRASMVVCPRDPECLENHYTVDVSYYRQDRLKPGCYVVGKGGRSFGFPAGTNLGYRDWRRDLSVLVLGAPPELVWDRHRKYRGKPFVELIRFVGGMGSAIGSMTSAKLHDDFRQFASMARRHYLAPHAATEASTSKVESEGMGKEQPESPILPGVNDLTWMWEVYRDFRKAFKLASNGGFVLFC
jgi:hypothetical protein